MALVFKVGDDDQMVPVPENFPTCGDYNPDLRSDGDSTEDLGTSKPTTGTPPNAGGGVSGLAPTLITLMISFMLVKL